MTVTNGITNKQFHHAQHVNCQPFPVVTQLGLSTCKIPSFNQFLLTLCNTDVLDQLLN